MSGALLKIILALSVDALACIGGALAYLGSGQVLWLVFGVGVSALVSIFVLLPAVQEYRKERQGGGNA